MSSRPAWAAYETASKKKKKKKKKPKPHRSTANCKLK
jgi:hypothetical protein